MTRTAKLALVAILTCLPALAEAQGNSNGRGNGNGNRADNPLNCPPGLAKREPACVPPGLARQGVTTQEYLNLSDDEWERATTENPDLQNGNEITVVEDDLITGPLTEEDIAELFGINPPADGNTYAIIDGEVVELSPGDRIIFDQLVVNSDAVSPGNSVGVVPDVGLTEEQLISVYDLPPAPDGTTYSVINGQIYAVPDDVSDVLQVIKLASALF